jgi:AIG2-like family
VTLYAAYGSNLDPHRMAQRAPASPAQGTGWLRGWRLTFAGEDVGWDGALSTVVEDPDSSVFVMLYDVPIQDEQALDAWEGAELGLWTKIRVRVHTGGGEQLAWLYVLEAYEGGLPSAHYLSVIADAAEAGGAPAEYVERLRMHPCRALGDLP